jgi:uncharacterized protein
VQATGFLKIADGENPLDGTWIHPESYAIAGRVLEAIGFGVNDLRASHGTTDAPREDMPDTSKACPETSAEVSSAGASAAVEPQGDGEASIAEETDSSATAASTVTDAAAVSASASHQAPGATAVSSPPVELPPDPVPQPYNDNVESMRNGAVAATASAVVEVHQGDQACPKPTSDHATRMLELAEKLAAVDVDQLAPDLGVGKLLLQDMLAALARPGRDPREDLPPPIFRRGVLKLEDLKSGMELSGTVLNVVDFGAFVDIGLVDSGLVHVSRLADRFIADPHDVVSVGDILRVWVVEVDQKRRRVSLTAIAPGTERPKPEKRKPQSGRSGAPQSKKGHRAKSKRPPQYGKGHKTTVSKPKSKPKPVVPITKKMEEGKEPMRTFGDLKQLFDKRTRGGGE